MKLAVARYTLIAKQLALWALHEADFEDFEQFSNELFQTGSRVGILGSAPEWIL